MIDFGVIDRGERDRNCSTRGGEVQADSPEKATQEQREESTLLVIYTSYSDIPPSPREPSEPLSGDSSVEKVFGLPKAGSVTKVLKSIPQLRFVCSSLFRNESRCITIVYAIRRVSLIRQILVIPDHRKLQMSLHC